MDNINLQRIEGYTVQLVAEDVWAIDEFGADIIYLVKGEKSAAVIDTGSGFGNLKKVGFILAVMHEPKLLILDEPTSGLDPIMQNVFFEVLREEKAKGTTCLYSTHILSEVSKICDRVGIIKDGHLIQVEEIEELFGKNLGFVTLESPDSEKILKDLQVENISTDEKIIKFANPFPHDALIKRLAKYEIKRIQIQEMSLEDLFLHYYK